MRGRAVAAALGGMAVLVVVAGCGPGGAEPMAGTRDAAGTTAPAGQLDGSWQLVAGRATDGPLPVLDTAPVTLVVAGAEVSGTSACNSYSATVRRDGDRFEVGLAGGTEMACEPPVMDLEQRYLAALPSVRQAQAAGDRLVLAGTGVRLEFRRLPPVPTAALVGTTWVLESLLQGDTAASTVGSPAELVLRADGTVAGSTGCRPFVGRYVVHGSEVVMSELDASLEPIEECPPDTAAQDAQVLEVLGDGFRVSVDGRSLVAENRDGERGLAYRAE